MYTIGISGDNGCGKDTLGSMLSKVLDTYGVVSTRIAFADALYSTCENLFDTPPKSACDSHRVLKESLVLDNITMRQLLINVGEGMRSIYPKVWVDVVQRKIESSGEVQTAIITDVRYQNEADICDLLFKVKDRGKGGSVVLEHTNSLFISNKGSLEDLLECVNNASKSIVRAILNNGHNETNVD